MRILLTQTSFLGDVVLSTPVISALKTLYPESELWMLTTPAGRELVRSDPLLAGVVAFDKRGADRGVSGFLRKACELRALEFSRCFSLHRSARSALLLARAGIPHRVGFRGASLNFLYHELRTRDRGRHDVHRNLQLVVEDTDLGRYDELRLFAPDEHEIGAPLRSELPADYIVLVPGSAWATKQWDWREYRLAAQELLNQGNNVVLVGDARERELNLQVARDLSVVNLAGRTSVRELLFVLSRARLIICNDSMSLQVASAFKIPTVTVFCATSPAFGFGPWKNNAIVVERQGLYCKPCARHGGTRCPTGTWACTREVSHREVIEAAGRVLAGGSR